MEFRSEIASIRGQMVSLLAKLDDLEQSVMEEDATIEDFIVTTLRRSSEPLTAREIAGHVLDAGYRTHAKDFAAVVYQALNVAVKTRTGRIRKTNRKAVRPNRYALRA